MEGYSTSSSSDSDNSSHTPSIGSMPSYYEPGVYFHLHLTCTFYRISSVTCKNVEAVIVKPGEMDLLHGESKIF